MMNESESTSYPLSQQETQRRIQARMKGTFNEFLGMEVLQYEPNHCLCRLPIKPIFLNPLGSLHGGLLFTLADSTAGIASIDFSKGDIVTTLQSDIQFLNPGLQLDEIYAEATCVKNGKRIAFTEVQIFTKEKKLLCKANFSFAKLEKLPSTANTEQTS